MDDEALNASIRKFLRTVGVNSQREIEQAAAAAASAATDKADKQEFTATMTLEIAELGLKVTYDGSIKLQ